MRAENRIPLFLITLQGRHPINLSDDVPVPDPLLPVLPEKAGDVGGVVAVRPPGSTPGRVVASAAAGIRWA
jgi:hypothetical protein